MSERCRMGILISGRGSNMIALVEAIQRGEITADVALVLSNKPDAPGLEAAAAHGVPVAVVDQRQVKPRKVHEARVIERLMALQPRRLEPVLPDRRGQRVRLSDAL